MDINPLLADWTTPFGIPPFDAIGPAHFSPAFAEAMRLHAAEIAAIGADPSPPGFANTIAALQRSGRVLARVENVFSNLVASQGGDALDAVDTEMSPILAQHWARVSLDPAVFARVRDLHDRRATLSLDEDQARLLDRVHTSFVRSGAALEAPGRARMAEISQRLAVLHTQFGQNVLHDERSWHLPLTEAELEGLPGFLRDGARQAAKERGFDGHAITLSRSLVEPFLAFSTRRDLRQQAYGAWIARGAHPGPYDNLALIPEILALRAERAGLLGYESYAAYRLADTMAGTPEAAHALLTRVWEPACAKAAAERDRLIAAARAEGFNGELAAWDWRFYAERVRSTEYELDEEQTKPFFALENIQRAAFDIAGRLFGLHFTPVPDAPVYHQDVRIFEVRDTDGHVGVFLADHFARPTKRSGAWMSSFRDQETMDEAISPIIVNNNNFARAEPTLLSFDDASTLFHEFGHALHGLLSRVRFPLQSGTSVKRDFVEFPSQIYEHWFELPQTLRSYALHQATGEALPDAVAGRLLAARNFNQGFATVEYTSAALIDLALHTHPDPARLDIVAFERAFLAQIGMPPDIGLRHRPAHFQHLFAGGGYAAGYYAYMWAEVLDADGFAAFTEVGDPFDPALASRLRAVFAAGDSKDPMALYTAFRGRAPDVDALLRGRDLVEA